MDFETTAANCYGAYKNFMILNGPIQMAAWDTLKQEIKHAWLEAVRDTCQTKIEFVDGLVLYKNYWFACRGRSSISGLDMPFVNTDPLVAQAWSVAANHLQLVLSQQQQYQQQQHQLQIQNKRKVLVPESEESDEEN